MIKVLNVIKGKNFLRIIISIKSFIIFEVKEKVSENKLTQIRILKINKR
jgi:hypothetical protein